MAPLTVIVPTLNEVENIDPLIKRICRTRLACKLDIDILFVDSSSSDGTGDQVLAWQSREPVRLLRYNNDLGLAGAVLAGVKETDAKYVLVMDADLSHPPEAIPQLFQPLLDGTHNMVIGSRYVAGGSVPDWPLSRRLCSRLATFPALFFCQVKDPLAGFFAVERRLLTGMADSVPGFKIGLALLAEYHREIRVAEIPIRFHDREYGESKMDYRVVLAYLQQLLGLTLKRLRNNRCKNRN